MQQAQTAYKATSVQTKTDRSLEFEAIARITTKLRAANEAGTKFPELVSAVDENRRLWTFIASSVSEQDNRLPENLRAQLFFLSEFTSLHSKKVLREEADTVPLIDINLSVMRGLGTEPQK